jgi:hypothetical protein
MFVIKKNNRNEFFTVDGITDLVFLREEEGFMELDSVMDPVLCGIKKHPSFACIWPFYDGYARVLGKDGRWGYMSDKDLSISWLDNNVLYADDFICGLARVQFVDKSFNYIDRSMSWLSQFNYEDTTPFENGNAIISDKICKHYQIDTKGNITEKDQRRYKIALEYAEILREEEKKKEKNRNQESRTQNKRKVCDPETDIMNSLLGRGGDPDEFGF